ncbi:hypothetical protein Tco_0443136 [Tanacetum coccineum]
MLLYIKGNENGKLIIDSVLNGPFKYGTVTVPGTQTTPATVRDKTYDELTYAEKLHESYDIKATNIVLQGLPQDIYNMVNHHEEAKHIWDRVKLLIEGSTILLQERESKLYDDFDIFTLQQVSPLASQQLYDVPMAQQRSYQALIANHSLVVHYQSYQAPDVHQPSQALVPIMDSRLVVPLFLPSDDLIVSLNKATVQDGRVTVQTVQGRQNQGYAGSGARSNATAAWVNRTGGANTTGQAKVIYAFDSDCDEASSASVVLMAKLSSYDSEILSKQHDALSVIDTVKTLELAEESRLKMHAKQNDPVLKEKKVNIAPIDYVALNKLSKHFVKHFEPQTKLSAEQAFWLPISKPVSKTPPVQLEPVLKEIPCELPIISLVKDSFNKMRNHVNDFENVATVSTKVIGQNEGSWGFEHIQKAFDKDVKPFVKTLKEYFHMFDQGLHKEITDMKEVFPQMENEAAKCSVKRKNFEIKEKELLLENDCLLELITSKDLVHTAVNSLSEIIDYQSIEKSFLDEYSKCVELKPELSKKNDMVEKAVYDELLKRCARMENRCISLKIKVQQYKESFQNNQPRNKPDALEFLAFFEINELKAQLEAKNNSISELKDDIATFKGKGVSECDKSVNISKEHDDTLHEIVENARALMPLESDLKSACRTFTIDGNMCPLTRITSTTIVPPKKPISATVFKKTPPISNTSGKLKDITNIGSSSKSKNVESKISNNSKPNKNWGSNVSTTPSSPRVHFRSFKSSFGKSKKYAHKPKFDDFIQEKLYLLHIDLCGPMRIESINGKKYIMVIIDDYSL